MPTRLTVLMGKAIRSAARLRGGGSALPGLFIERISPRFVPDTLAQLPQGVIVISGTNGKTTTTKMVVALLEAAGLNVFTNRTGSNFVRGVAAALLGAVDTRGKLDADIAVLELDEAHAVKFVNIIAPRYSLLLNVMRDQLDRFGEIDTTARFLEHIARATTGTVVFNLEDSRIARIAAELPSTIKTRGFGLDPALRSHFPSDEALLDGDAPARSSVHTTPGVSPDATSRVPTRSSVPDVTLKDYDDDTATFTIDNHDYQAPLKLSGVYNIYNAAAALALVRAITLDTPTSRLLTALSQVTPAFGRGEVLTVGGQPLELVLVKNPGGFRLGLKSYDPTGYATMIAINDNYADGRDMSWLWDVDFTSLRGTAVTLSGIRAFDIALRLQYEAVDIGSVTPGLSDALRQFIADHADQPKRIYCTYTAMTSLRRELSKMTTVEVIS